MATSPYVTGASSYEFNSDSVVGLDAEQINIAASAGANAAANNALSIRGSTKLMTSLRSCSGASQAPCDVAALREELSKDAQRQSERVDAACGGGGNMAQCVALASSSSMSLNFLLGASSFADTAEKQALVSDMLGQQINDMTKLFDALSTQQAAAGVTETLGAAITASLQMAGAIGVPLGSRYSSGSKLQQDLAARANVQPDTTRDTQYAAQTDKTVLTANKFDVNHVLAGEINAGGKATGYHAEFAANGGARIVLGAAVKQNPNGTYEAPVQIWDLSKGQWVTKTRDSTFFPPSWSQARIEYEVSEAFKNRIPVSTGGWKGTTPSNIDVQFFWDSKNSRTTFYPKG